MISHLRVPSGWLISLLAGGLGLTSVMIPSPLAAQTISTVAGNGSYSFSGDGGPATLASLQNPHDVAVDRQGNLFIADLTNHRIRKVATNGTITTIAGTGVQGFSGDSGPAVNALLNAPYGLAIDGQGNLFFTDTQNHRIRKIAPDGIITTVAGNGGRGDGGNGGPATEASLNFPHDVAVDGQGNLFISDQYNQQIRKVDTNGIITTVAGNGGRGDGGDSGPAINASLNFPHDVAVDEQGNLFIADPYNQRIRKVDTNGTITTVAGTGVQGFSGDGGQAINARLYLPSGLAVDGQGNLFVADAQNHRIRKIAPDGTINTVAGSAIRGYGGDGGPATNARLNNPTGITLDAKGNLFIAEFAGNRIRKVDILSVLSFSLINADTEQEIKVLIPGEQLNLATLPTRNLNFRVNLTPTTVGSVVMALSGRQGRTQTETAFPFALFGDSNGDYVNWTPPVGQYMITATPYFAASGTGMKGAAYSLNFSVVDQPNPNQFVTSFSLINADTEQEIKVLETGDQLNLASLPTRNLNIRANTSPPMVGSVVMVLSGRQNRTQSESTLPYSLFGDTNGDYRAWTPTPGNYSLTGTPFFSTTQRTTEAVVPSLTVNFSVVDNSSTARLSVAGDPESADLQVQYYPNPFWHSFTLDVQGRRSDKLPLSIYDLRGRRVWQQADGPLEQSISLGSELGAGTYILQVGVGSQTRRYKLLKAR